jgi:transcription antitermination factor NusB
MRKRSRARELALQILYQVDLLGPHVHAGIEEMLARERRDPDIVAYAWLVVRGVLASWDDLDRRIGDTAEHWDLPRMAVIDRNVLRLATWELLRADEAAPPRVVLNEAIELGKRFSTAQSGAFINGILDRILRTIEAEREAERAGPTAHGEGDVQEAS